MAQETSNSRVRRRRQEIERELTRSGPDAWKYFSTAIYSHWQMVIEDQMPRYLNGLSLDVGSGECPYRAVAERYASRLLLMDHNAQPIRIDLRGDIRHIPLTGGALDSVVCLQVLEHVANPFEGIAEMGRVLKPGGVLLLSVPHLSRLHELPHDYFRYTEYGLRELAKAGGFEVLELEPVGGLVSFLGHQLSMAYLTVFWPLRFLRPLTLFINKNLFTRFLLSVDKYLGFKSLFPQGYALVARKL